MWNKPITLLPTCSVSAWWCYEWWLLPCRWLRRRTVWAPAVSEGCRHVEVWRASQNLGTRRGVRPGARSQVAGRYQAPAGLPPVQRFHRGCRRHAGHCFQTGIHSASGWLWGPSTAAVSHIYFYILFFIKSIWLSTRHSFKRSPQQTYTYIYIYTTHN